MAAKRNQPGESLYTLTKQKHLAGILQSSRHAWNPRTNGKHAWAWPEVVFIDCTAGRGHDSDGNLGSPLIIHAWAMDTFSAYGIPFHFLCCESIPQTYVSLSHTNLSYATLRHGKYEDMVLPWLESLQVPRSKQVMGFLYCDPNGSKDLVYGVPLFRQILNDRRYARLDFIFHWSLTSHKRNFAAGNIWASEDELSLFDTLASLKKTTTVRVPIGQWQWVMMHCRNTDKVSGTWQKERFMSAAAWRDVWITGKGLS